MKLGIFLRNEMMCLLTNIQVSYDDVIFDIYIYIYIHICLYIDDTMLCSLKPDDVDVYIYIYACI